MTKCGYKKTVHYYCRDCWEWHSYDVCRKTGLTDPICKNCKIFKKILHKETERVKEQKETIREYVKNNYATVVLSNLVNISFIFNLNEKEKEV